jgi:hypothetical protein
MRMLLAQEEQSSSPAAGSTTAQPGKKESRRTVFLKQVLRDVIYLGLLHPSEVVHTTWPEVTS